MAQNEQNKLGYGVRLTNPEGFILAVIIHFFIPLSRRKVDWENLLHEARVALFEEDLFLGESIPETTSGYWWRVARAVGRLLWEDYRIDVSDMFIGRPRPFHEHDAQPDDPDLLAEYLEKQRVEPVPEIADAQSKDWFEHYMALAEGVLLDNEDAQQGERDLAVFELWVNGYSPKEIAERHEITWLSYEQSVDAVLRRIIDKLWDFFGVDRKEDDVTIDPRDSDPVDAAQKRRFNRWYADPANREMHLQRCRERQRQRRAEMKKAKEGQ